VSRSGKTERLNEARVGGDSPATAALLGENAARAKTKKLVNRFHAQEDFVRICARGSPFLGQAPRPHASGPGPFQ
jgi:hypothetical protein